jgi:hypothetical protein
LKEELLQLFLRAPVPDELEAQRRVWKVVRAAHAEREPVRRPRRRLAPALAFALLTAAVVSALVTPVRGWISDRFAGEPKARPALFRIPAAGRLLVLSKRGPWVVQRDGSKRLLGRYQGADFSPRGLFLVVTSGRRVTAVEPDGDPRWSVTRPQPVAQARWAPSGFRVAYRVGDTLRVVDGDGTNDRLLVRGVAPVAPAWRPLPDARNVLAYARANGSVHVVDVDSRRELWHTAAGPAVRQFAWSRQSLLVLTRTGGILYGGRRHGVVEEIEPPTGHVLLDAAFGPGGEGLVYTDFDPRAQETAVVRVECAGAFAPCRAIGPYAVFRGSGRLDDVAWSPNGHWLLIGFPDADQFLFMRVPGVRRVLPVGGIRREFDPGGEGFGPFPRIVGWCCAP